MTRANNHLSSNELPETGAVAAAISNLKIPEEKQAEVAASVFLQQMLRPEVVTHVNGWLREHKLGATGAVIAADEQNRVVLDIWPKPTTGLHFVVTRENPRSGELEIMVHSPLEKPVPEGAPEWLLPRGHLNPLKDTVTQPGPPPRDVVSLEVAKARLVWEKTGVALLSPGRFAKITSKLPAFAENPDLLAEVIERNRCSYEHTLTNLSTLSGIMRREATNVVLNGYHVHFLDRNVDSAAMDKPLPSPEMVNSHYQWVPVSAITFDELPKGHFPSYEQLSLQSMYNSDAVLIESAIRRVRDQELLSAEILPQKALQEEKTAEYFETIAKVAEELFELPNGSILRRHLFGKDNEYLQRIYRMDKIITQAKEQLCETPELAGQSIDSILSEISVDKKPILESCSELWAALEAIAGMASPNVPDIAARHFGVSDGTLFQEERKDIERLQSALSGAVIPPSVTAALNDLPPEAMALEALSLLRNKDAIAQADRLINTASPEGRDLLFYDASHEPGKHITLGHWPKPAVGVNLVITHRENEEASPQLLLGYKNKAGGQFVTIGGHLEPKNGANLDMTIVAELMEETGLTLLSSRFVRLIRSYLSNHSLLLEPGHSEQISLNDLEKRYPARISRMHRLEHVSETLTLNASDSITGYWLELKDKRPPELRPGDDVNALRWVDISELALERPSSEVGGRPQVNSDDKIIYLSECERAYREAIIGTVQHMHNPALAADVYGKMHSLEYYEEVAAAVEKEAGLREGSLLHNHIVGPTWQSYVPRTLSLAELVHRHSKDNGWQESTDPGMITEIQADIMALGSQWRQNGWVEDGPHARRARSPSSRHGHMLGG